AAPLEHFASHAASHGGGPIAATWPLTAPGENANTTDAATLDPISSASSDQQPAPTVTADGSAVNGLASNVATAPQPATTDATSSTQAGATTQTASAPSTASAAPATPAATGPNGDTFVF